MALAILFDDVMVAQYLEKSVGGYEQIFKNRIYHLICVFFERIESTDL